METYKPSSDIIKEIDNIKFEEETLKNLDEQKYYDQYKQYYDEDNDKYFKYKSKFFDLIYKNKKENVKDEDKCVKESEEEYAKLAKLYQGNGIFEIEEFLKIYYNKFIEEYGEKNLENEINNLKKPFNCNKDIDPSDIINNIKVFLKRDYIFDTISGIISYIDTIKPNKTKDYFDELIKMQPKKDNKDIKNIFEKLKELNIDIFDDKNNQYIDILIELKKKPNIILFLFEIDGNKIKDNKENNIKIIQKYCKIFNNLEELKKKDDKTIIESFKKKVIENKDIFNDLNEFKELINNNYLYDCLYKYGDSCFKEITLSKNLVNILLQNVKNSNDILQSLFYLKNNILFFEVLNENKDLIIKIIKNENKLIDVEKYIKFNKNDNLNKLKEELISLSKSDIKKYIKFNPSIFDIFIKDVNKKNYIIINDIINNYKTDDNQSDFDNYIQNNILKLVDNQKLNNDELIKQMRIFKNKKNVKLLPKILNGINIIGLTDKDYKEWKEIYKSQEKEFNEKIISLIKNINDFKKIFSFEDDKTKNELKKKFNNELIQQTLNSNNIKNIIELILFTDKNYPDIIDQLFNVDIHKNINDEKKLTNIYKELDQKYENELSDKSKNVICNNLIKKPLLTILKECPKIKNDIISNRIDNNKFDEKKFLNFEDKIEKDKYELLKNLIEENIIQNKTEIPHIYEFIENINKKIEDCDFDNDDLNKAFNDKEDYFF